MNGTTTTILAAGCTLGGITIGVIAVSVTRGGITPDTMYGTGLGLAIISVGLVVAALLLKRSAEDNEALSRKLTDIERAVIEHKRHDKDALREAFAWNGDESGPNQVHHIRR